MARRISRLAEDDALKLSSAQAVSSLAGLIKELLENALDAGATNVTIRCVKDGVQSVECADNGVGISADDCRSLCVRGATSKSSVSAHGCHASTYDGEVETFGFRGEALSSVANLASSFQVVTRTRGDTTGRIVSYNERGEVTSERPSAREVGTTVTVTGFFEALPVRRKTLQATAKTQIRRAVALCQAYLVFANAGVRVCFVNNGSVAFAGGSNGSPLDNYALLYGEEESRKMMLFSSHPNQSGNSSNNSQATSTSSGLSQKLSDSLEEPERYVHLKEFEATSDDYEAAVTNAVVRGVVSRPAAGCGRAAADRQFVFFNRRPCRCAALTRVINEVYRAYNRAQLPAVFVDVRLPPTWIDANISADKTDVVCRKEGALLAMTKLVLLEAFNAVDAQLPCTQQSQFAMSRTQELSKVKSNATDGATDFKQDSQTNKIASKHTGLSTQLNEITTPVTANSNDSKSSGVPKGVSRQGFLSQFGYNKSLKMSNVDSNNDVDAEQEAHPPHFTAKKGEENSVLPPKRKLELDNNGTVDEFCFLSRAKQVRMEECFQSKEVNKKVSDPNENDVGSCEAELIAETNVSSIAERESHNIEIGNTTNQQGPRAVCDLSEPNTRSVSDEAEDIEEDASTGNNMICRRKTELSGFEASFSFQSVQDCDSLSMVLSGRGNSGKGDNVAVLFDPTQADDGSSKPDVGPLTKETLFGEMRVVGQFNYGFIVGACRSADGKRQRCFIIDQHAADEKSNFERLESEPVPSHTLILPMPLLVGAGGRRTDFSPHDCAFLAEPGVLDTFRRNGFDFVLDTPPIALSQRADGDCDPDDFSESRDAAEIPEVAVAVSRLPSLPHHKFGLADVYELMQLCRAKTTLNIGNGKISKSSTTGDFDAGDALGGLGDTTSAATSSSTCNVSSAADPVATALPKKARQMPSVAAGVAARPAAVSRSHATMACRKSVMVGKCLERGLMQRIVRRLGELSQPWHCPHGRPTIRPLCEL